MEEKDSLEPVKTPKKKNRSHTNFITCWEKNAQFSFFTLNLREIGKTKEKYARQIWSAMIGSKSSILQDAKLLVLCQSRVTLARKTPTIQNGSIPTFMQKRTKISLQLNHNIFFYTTSSVFFCSDNIFRSKCTKTLFTHLTQAFFLTENSAVSSNVQFLTHKIHEFKKWICKELTKQSDEPSPADSPVAQRTTSFPARTQSFEQFLQSDQIKLQRKKTCKISNKKHATFANKTRTPLKPNKSGESPAKASASGLVSFLLITSCSCPPPDPTAEKNSFIHFDTRSFQQIIVARQSDDNIFYKETHYSFAQQKLHEFWAQGAELVQMCQVSFRLNLTFIIKAWTEDQTVCRLV